MEKNHWIIDFENLGTLSEKRKYLQKLVSHLIKKLNDKVRCFKDKVAINKYVMFRSAAHPFFKNAYTLFFSCSSKGI